MLHRRQRLVVPLTQDRPPPLKDQPLQLESFLERTREVQRIGEGCLRPERFEVLVSELLFAIWHDPLEHSTRPDRSIAQEILLTEVQQSAERIRVVRAQELLSNSGNALQTAGGALVVTQVRQRSR